MYKKVFYSEDGREWLVQKTGLSFAVSGERKDDEKLYEIAKSCAFQLGITSMKNGIPLTYINQHQRIWNLIWHKGKKHNQSSHTRPGD